MCKKHNASTFVKVNSGRRLVPTPLGTTLVRGYQCIDADLCLPDIRSFIEQQITLIAKGKADHREVIQHVIQQFMKKYSYFVKKVTYLFIIY
jgi:DNA topoisomerase-3